MPAACGFLQATAKPILNMGFILEINLLVCYNMVMFLKVCNREESDQTADCGQSSFRTEYGFS